MRGPRHEERWCFPLFSIGFPLVFHGRWAEGGQSKDVKTKDISAEGSTRHGWAPRLRVAMMGAVASSDGSTRERSDVADLEKQLAPRKEEERMN